jgi:hypothetical protein
MNFPTTRHLGLHGTRVLAANDDGAHDKARNYQLAVQAMDAAEKLSKEAYAAKELAEKLSIEALAAAEKGIYYANLAGLTYGKSI